MASFFSFITTKKFPSQKTLRELLRGPLTFFSALFYVISFLICATVFILIIVINNHFLVTVPARGGNLTEGVIGAPEFINPITATTDTDLRLTSLVYGSLMQTQPDGTSTTELAQSYTVSPDGKTYTLTLLPGTMFDDGKPLTSDDVLFTVTKLQDDNVSSASHYWQAISVDNPNPSTVVFTLPAADTTFLSHLNFGILPKHIWQNVSDENFDTTRYNLHPVGSGLFKVSRLSYHGGIPFSVVLTRNKHAVQGKPLLDSLTMNFYANQSDLLNAINDHDIDFSYDITPDTLAAGQLMPDLSVQSVPTDQTVDIYRANNDTSLSSGTSIAAISETIDKNAIIAKVQDGYGTPAGAQLNSPGNSAASSTAKLPVKGLSLAVENDSTLLLAAQTFAGQLARYGLTVSVNAFDPGTFQADIAAGAFPLFLARSSDQDIPLTYALTIPLYTESLPYIFNTNVHLIPPETYQSPAMEYEDVQNWYTRTDKLWKVFIPKDRKE
jgi:peptide/nickel transport system substrate-binding protein